ncbi:putative polyketide synthase [Hypoxylon sp. FL1284]|nr:putative polyketide synthase [Hypoxylon sp. FL1284]
MTASNQNSLQNGHQNGHQDGYLNGHQNGHENGHENGHQNGYQNGHQNGYQNGHITNGVNGNEGLVNGNLKAGSDPIVICGMACRLPGGISSPQEFWNFLVEGRDGRSRVPKSRYNTDAYFSRTGKPGTTRTHYGYFIDDDLQTFDASCFNMSIKELQHLDPLQRLALFVARECVDDAGAADVKGQHIGVYMGTIARGWSEMSEKDIQSFSAYDLLGMGNFSLSNRVSYEMGLTGPSMTIDTACASSFSALNEACRAIGQGDCESAIVGGASLILGTTLTLQMGELGALAVDGSCKTFDASANGYARAEGINAVYIKPLSAALRDGNPVRAVIRGISTSHNGRSAGITSPDVKAQQDLIRQTYQIAGIQNPADTPFVECHGTGTPRGDRMETAAVGSVFGSEAGVYIGSVKACMGHSEGASGLTSLIKAVLALENKTIPPNIKFNTPNPEIPFQKYNLTVPTEPTPWPQGRKERISVSNYGVGGANAHVIVDSASSFNASPELEESGDNPQLLVFSANSSESLKKIMDRYDEYLTKYPERIEDVAYTLANKRQHLENRAFIVATREKPGSPSTPAKHKSTPSIVMVFTGQGAQWPQMSRDLMKTNQTFKASIKAMDGYLKSLGQDGPSWTIEGELRKPAKTSKLGLAELSQPLCTAIQVALVDAFKAVGIEPSAVVGHSSGEIAGAYASGALSAQEAIVAAFQRGAVAREQTRAGTMAAIGMSWKEVDEFLVAGVTVACENSPRSVTISGDAAKVEEVVAAISTAKPDVLARLLKVDKAYHSYHMAEIGGIYLDRVGTTLAGKAPTKPFFSSVKGRILGKNDVLSAQYWQQNLESPVLFKDAVSLILKHPVSENAVFLEIGPHSALAGPLRQILSEYSNQSPYIASMLRGQDCTESFLSALGKLYTMNAPIDFKALYPRGTALPGLPTYQWANTGAYWHETRVMREWRERRFRHHDLLGVKTAESTDIEPVWRNLFHLDYAPWIRDHVINGDVVMPFAAYIAMVGEAIRQVTGVEQGFKLRNVNATTALVVPENSIEIITAFHRHKSAGPSESQWWEFTIASHNGNMWVRHFRGEAAPLEEPLGPAKALPDLPREVDVPQWFNAVTKTGLHFGPSFRCMGDVKCSASLPGMATATITNDPLSEESDYHIHPTAIDNAFQIVLLAALRGLSRGLDLSIITTIKEISITRCPTAMTANVLGYPNGDSSISGDADLLANGQTVLSMKGVSLNILKNPNDRDTQGGARYFLDSHVDLANPSDLIRPMHDYGQFVQVLGEVVDLALVHTQQAIPDGELGPAHLRNYKAWVSSQAETAQKPSLEQLDKNALLEAIGAKVKNLSGTPVEHIASAIYRVAAAIGDILSGNADATNILSQGDLLTKLVSSVNNFDTSSFIRALAHTKPDVRVLELGAGSGSSTGKYLDDLQSLYSKYTVTDASSSLVAESKERHKGRPNIEFAALDINKDLELYNFAEGREYDLIIATNILHEGDSISQSLKNIRSLLHPRGRLLLQETTPSCYWMKFVLGLLPSWWRGAANDVTGEPRLTGASWEAQLKDAGFEAVDAIIPDSKESSQLCNFLIARPEADKPTSKEVTVLTADTTSDAGDITTKLAARGYTVTRTVLGDQVPAGKDIIALLDQDSPFLQDMAPEAFDHLQKLVIGLGESGIFWITRPAVVKITNPYYAETIGLARNLRTELDVDFATCQTETDFSDSKVLDSFEHFHRRHHGETLAPEMEYIIKGGKVNVGRYHPISLIDEQLTIDDSDEARLTIGTPGRLTDFKWLSCAPRALTGSEVEIEVFAAGLNDKDLSHALGAAGAEKTVFGVEAAGVIRRVGPNTMKLRVGDRVVAVGQGALATSLIQRESAVTRIPGGLSFNDAATMPFAYATAIHSLINVGGLDKGENVLIHRAASSVGIAAIQVATVLGARVFATVASDEEKQYVATTFNLPPNQIFSSHTSSFAAAVLNETSGHCVEVVLNTLSGDLLRDTWSCVAEFGKLVDISESNYTGAGSLDIDFSQNRAYHTVDMHRIIAQRPAIVGQHLDLAMKYYCDGSVAPIHVAKAFGASQIADAFNELKKDAHIGKLVMEMRSPTDNSSLIPAIEARMRPVKFDQQASYILCGGLGGLGRQVAIWMAENGAGNLIFLSPSAGSSPESQKFVHELESMGTGVQIFKGSVDAADLVASAVTEAKYPVKGAVNMAMVLRDRSWDTMTHDDWFAVAGPKVQGSWNLHNATQAAGLNLDFFVMFSSTTAVFGVPGQTNYAAANVFLDAFARYRNGLGLSATTINVGVVEDTGVASRDERVMRAFKANGYMTISSKEVLDAMALAVAAPSPRAGRGIPGRVDPSTFVIGLGCVIPLASSDNQVPWRRDPRMGSYHNSSSSGDASRSNGHDDLKSFLAAARTDREMLRKDETATALAMEIGRKVLALQGQPADELRTEQGLADLGMDSLVGIEMRKWWKTSFGFDISLLEMLGMGNLEQLGRHAAQGLYKALGGE